MIFRELPIRAGGSGGGSATPKNLTIENAGKAPGSETYRIRVYWGTINNIQADQFSAGDRIPLLLDVAGGSGIVYAEQTANLSTRQWVSVSIKISSNLAIPNNTKNTIYTLLGTYTIQNKTLFVVSWGGGDIYHSFCELSV